MPKPGSGRSHRMSPSVRGADAPGRRGRFPSHSPHKRVKRKILIYGYATHVDHLIAMVSTEDMEFVRMKRARLFLWAPRVIRADALYSIGGSLASSRVGSVARLFRVPRVMHWVGTDCLNAARTVRESRVVPHLVTGCRHWAITPWLSEELEGLGVRAEVVPLSSPHFPLELPDLPTEFTALAYLPEKRAEFYGGPLVLRLARAHPDIRFLVVGSTATSAWLRDEEIPRNVELLGRVESIGTLYRRSTVLIRQPKHDGLAMMVLESLAHGRYAIWNHALGPVITASNYDAVSTELRRLRDRHVAGRLEVDRRAAAWVRREYAPDKIASAVRKRLHAVCDERSGKGLRRRSR